MSIFSRWGKVVFSASTPSIYKDGNFPFNLKTRITFRTFQKVVLVAIVSTKASPYIFQKFQIVSLNWLVQKKMIYTVFLKAFGLRLVGSRLLVYLGRGQTALGKGKGAHFPFLCACNKQQNSKVTPVSLYSAVLSASRRSI